MTDNKSDFSSLEPFVRFSRSLSVSSPAGLSGRVPLDRRIFFLSSGCARFTAGDRVFDLGPGDLVYIPSGVFYSVGVPSGGAVFLALNFDLAPSRYSGPAPVAPVAPEDFRECDLSESVLVSDAPELDSPFLVPDAGDLGELIEKIDGEYSDGVVFSRSVAGAYLVSLLAACIRRLRFGAGGVSASLSERVLDYLHRNCLRRISNAEIGEAFFLHPNHLSAVVKKRTGMSLHRYLVFLRLNRAAKLLETGGMSVCEIAAECGFCDASHFSREFKKHFFVSPSDFAVKN
ncbi:MAG: helix-turn-helix domain-containing protein [Clostridia bacterium]|nr:helix-turn-helix domain-containing protein [Clostridia bacterium]